MQPAQSLLQIGWLLFIVDDLAGGVLIQTLHDVVCALSVLKKHCLLWSNCLSKACLSLWGQSPHIVKCRWFSVGHSTFYIIVSYICVDG